MRKIADSTVKRLSKYLRLLQMLENQGVSTVSSQRIAQMEGVTPAQVRKDLSYFGSFGRRGLGYPVAELRAKIRRIMGLHLEWQVAMVGAGNLGTALIDYSELRAREFHILQVYDSDPAKIGRQIKGLEVRNVRDLARGVTEAAINIVILAVPADAAQQVADMLHGTTVKAILNFAPRTITAPKGILVRSEDTSMEMEAITYYLTRT